MQSITYYALLASRSTFIETLYSSLVLCFCIKVYFLLALHSLQSQWRTHVSCDSSELYTMCNVQGTRYIMCDASNGMYLMKKSPLKTRIKRIETFIIYALFSVVAIYFFHFYLLLALLIYLWCICLYHINKCDTMHSTIFARAHIYGKLHMGTRAQIFIIM